jgi:dimethylamine/trimethylamine dehydrogenase
LSTWGRVLDYRLSALRTAPNVGLFLDSPLGVEDVLEFGCERVVLATGSRWTRELYALSEIPAGALEEPAVYTPDDLAAGAVPEGPVAVFDYDNYYIGGLVAESLAARGLDVSYVTTAGNASAWTVMTNELPRVHQALARAGVEVHTLQRVAGFADGGLTLQHMFTERTTQLGVRSLVIVGLRRPNDSLFHALQARSADLAAAGIVSLDRIGDALAPGAIAHAVHSGHEYGREFDRGANERRYRRDRPVVTDPFAEFAYAATEA